MLVARVALLLLGTGFWAGAVLAQDPEVRKVKEPWEWTTEERLEARYDPQGISQRNLRAMEEWGQTPEKLHGETSRMIRIDGEWNPELFLPWELFQHLVGSGYLDPQEFRQPWREVRMDRAQHLPLGERFWQRLETAVGPYLALVRAERQGFETPRRLADSTAEADAEVASQLLCEARADALEAARQEFGGQTFDRFLYEAVAPGVGIGHSADRGPWILEYVGRGCR